MTALVLTVYPRQPRTPGPGKGWADWRRDQDRECRMAHDKRFSDAELAAEWHRHDHTFGLLTEGIGVETFGNDYIRGSSHEVRALNQRNTLLRFATHPHYYEETE